MLRKHSLSQEQKQRQSVSQSLSMAIKITELTGTDIVSYLQHEALGNPLIEIVMPEICHDFPNASYGYNHPASSGKSPDEVMEAVCPAAAESLYDHLKKQLHMEKGLSAPLQTLTQYLILQLDESGFLRLNTDELAAKYHIPPQTMRDAITLLQSFDPAGIGARSLIECYLLQLKHLEKVPIGLKNILQTYGAELLHKQLSKITAATRFSSEELYDMLHFINKLSPAPGKSFKNETTIYIYPDLFLTIINDRPVLRYADETIPTVHFLQSDYIQYISMSNDVCMFARQRFSHYKYIQRSLQMRKRTLLSVGSFIAAQQSDYFLYDKPLHPLSLKHIAEACHISISTASRTIKNKYIRTDKGVYALGTFLSREFSSNNTMHLSVSYIKQMLSNIISREDKNHPYSDYQLEKIFRSIHIPVARRTITKYRRSICIPDSRYRKINMDH